MTRKINIGLIGLGRLGRNYADYFANRIPAANLMAISDIDQQSMDACANEFGVSKCFNDYRDLIADKEVDAVVIVTSTSTHRDIILAAARHGKAIFCEKPLTLSLQEGVAIKHAIDDAGVFFHMGFMRRFDKGYIAAKRQIEDGVIGTPVVFQSTTRDPNPPPVEYLKVSGGLFTDMGIHDFDLARWFMGEVENVYASGAALAYPEIKEIGDIDNGIANLNFENGTMGVVNLCRNGISGYHIRTEIVGTKGTIQVGYLRETPIEVMTREGVCHDTVPFFMERFMDAYITQLENFVENIIEEKEPAITCNDGVEVLKISLAAKSSYMNKQAVAIRDFN